MMRMVSLEFRKAFCRRSILIALVLLSLLNLWKVWDGYREISYLAGGRKSEIAEGMRDAYRELYKAYGGTIIQEKVDGLAAWYGKVYAASRGEIPLSSVALVTSNIYGDLILAEQYYALPMQKFVGYAAEADAVAAKAKENYRLYTELGNDYDAKRNAYIYHLYLGRSVGEFAYTEGYDAFANYQFSIVLTLFLCLYGIVHVFIPEKETQMGLLLLTTTNGGKRLTWAKIVAATAYIAGVTIWFYLLDAGSFTLVYGTIEGGSLPLYALKGFDGAAVNWSSFQYAVAAGFYRLLGMWSFCMILLLLTEFFQNALVPFIGSIIVTAAIVLLGSFFAYSSHVWFKILNPYSMLHGSVLFSQTDFINVFGVPSPSYQAAPVAAAAVGSVAVALMFLCEKRNIYFKRGGKHANLSL